jgi:hypothetical protein
MIKVVRQNLFLVLGTVVAIVYTALLYYGQFRYQYPIAPGDDVYNHFRLAEMIRNNPAFWPQQDYPPGLHYLLLGVSYLFEGSLLDALIYIWPLLLVLSALSLWLLAVKVFGKKTGFLAYLIYVFLSLQPLQTAHDGTLANLLAGNTFLPIALALWYLTWNYSGKVRYWMLIGFLIASCLIIYTHHLSTIILLGVVASSGLVFVAKKLRSGHSFVSTTVRMLFLTIFLTLVAAVAVYYVPIFSSVKALIQASLVIGSEHKTWSLLSFPKAVSATISVFGFLGAVYVAFQVIKDSSNLAAWRGRVVVVVWFLIYFVGSRFSFIGEPERLGRDLAMPGAILAGYVIIALWEKLYQKRALFFVFLAVLIVVALGDATVKLGRELRYNKMVRFSEADLQLKNIITQEPQPTGKMFVLVRNPMWEIVASEELAENRFSLLYKTDEAIDRFQNDGCLYASVYKPGTWPPELQSDEPLRVIEQATGVKPKYMVEDTTKIWYLFCNR